MNVLAGNVSSSQNLTFTRNPYGFWFNGTNEAYGLPGSKLEDSSFINSGVGSIALYLTQVYKNGILIYNNLDEVFYAESNLDYNFRDDGYGIGFSSYIDVLNDVLITYNFLTRFYPTGGDSIVGLINSKENFEIRFQEFASGPDIVTDYRIKVESYSTDPFYTGPGKVFDTIDGSTMPWF